MISWFTACYIVFTGSYAPSTSINKPNFLCGYLSQSAQLVGTYLKSANHLQPYRIIEVDGSSLKMKLADLDFSTSVHWPRNQMCKFRLCLIYYVYNTGGMTYLIHVIGLPYYNCLNYLLLLTVSNPWYMHVY